ncbi:MAG: HPr(Ser) kinase/phosphatase [Clostridia bacterium]|nr:HPr(Ser) kinase/phosphatase [Clostridia bacterium]
MEEKIFTVKLGDIIKTFKFEKIFTTPENELNEISTPDINRPSLQITGFYDYFDSHRIQILGMVENTYLMKLDESERIKRLEMLLSHNIPALLVTRNMDIIEGLTDLAKKYNVPLLRTKYSTSEVVSGLIAWLRKELAPRITCHGVLVEVYGEGILILGESGVGKSETAVELVKRGHRLVADDAVEIKKVSAISLVGSSPEIIRHFIELRGVGIIDVKEIFGIGAVKNAEKIDMVINLEPWVEGKHYDRLGIEDEYTEILGIQIPSLLIPVKPGRNLAIIIEIAAMNNRQKRNGYNAAEELNKRLMKGMEGQI